MFQTPLDSDLLRTFLAIVDTGSISGGAERIGRSQSAVSLQMKRLETVLGKPVFLRHGRGVVLTQSGERLETAARKTVSLLDTALADIRADDLSGAIRVGIPDAPDTDALSRIVAMFSHAHPLVEMDVTCGPGPGFHDAVLAGRLDLAVHEVDVVPDGAQILRSHAMFMVTSKAHDAHERDPLPVAVFDQDCWWRDVALEALRRSGLAHRIVFSCESVPAVSAAIDAGAAIGMLGEHSLGSNHRVLDEPAAFRDLPTSKLILERRRGFDTPVGTAMADAITSAFGEGA